jgi:hypothetical protein
MPELAVYPSARPPTAVTEAGDALAPCGSLPSGGVSGDAGYLGPLGGHFVSRITGLGFNLKPEAC